MPRRIAAAGLICLSLVTGASKESRSPDKSPCTSINAKPELWLHKGVIEFFSPAFIDCDECKINGPLAHVAR
jgi:hypothetical protein